MRRPAENRRIRIETERDLAVQNAFEEASRVRQDNERARDTAQAYADQLIPRAKADEQLKVVVFDSAVEGFFLNHSDFSAKLEDLTSIPQGQTGLEAWPDVLVRLTRAPVVSIALTFSGGRR